MNRFVCYALAALWGCAPAPPEAASPQAFAVAKGVRVDIASQPAATRITAGRLELDIQGQKLRLTEGVTWSQGEALQASCDRALLDSNSGAVVLESNVKASLLLETEP